MLDGLVERENLDNVVNNALSNFGCNKRIYCTNQPNLESKLSENEETREQMAQLYGLIIYNNSKILEILKDQRNIVKKRLKYLHGHGEFKELIEKICDLKTQFCTIYSWVIQSVVCNFPNYSANFTLETNLFVIEFVLCNTIRRFRESLDTRVINLIYEINQDLELKLTKHQEFLIQSLNEFNTMGVNLFYGWDFEKLKNDITRVVGNESQQHQINNINICDLLSDWSKIFIRKKLGMLPVHKILNEDVMDFFRYYQVKFNSESLFIIGYLKCFRYDIKREQCIEGFLCLDVNFTFY